MTQKKKKSMIYPTIFMICLTAILTFLLATLNAYTLPLVEQNEELDLNRKILSVFDIGHDRSNSDIVNKFNENISDTGETYNEEPIYAYTVDGEIKGYAVSLKGSGIWGPIVSYIGLSPDYTEILGIDFIQQEETPGLGGRIEEKFYKEQYRNIPADGIRDNVDAISGATGTSNAVFNFLTSDLENFINTVGGSN